MMLTMSSWCMCMMSMPLTERIRSPTCSRPHSWAGLFSRIRPDTGHTGVRGADWGGGLGRGTGAGDLGRGLGWGTRRIRSPTCSRPHSWAGLFSRIRPDTGHTGVRGADWGGGLGRGTGAGDWGGGRGRGTRRIRSPTCSRPHSWAGLFSRIRPDTGHTGVRGADWGGGLGWGTGAGDRGRGRGTGAGDSGRGLGRGTGAGDWGGELGQGLRRQERQHKSWFLFFAV